MILIDNFFIHVFFEVVMYNCIFLPALFYRVPRIRIWNCPSRRDDLKRNFIVQVLRLSNYLRLQKVSPESEEEKNRKRLNW